MSMDQEFKSSLARWFWLGISHKSTVTLAEATDISRACLGLASLLPRGQIGVVGGRISILSMWVSPHQAA